MATLQDLYTALKNAEAAGDSAAARSIAQAIQATRGVAAPVEQPSTAKSGFMPALKAGFENLKGDIAAVGGRAGLMSLPEAEKYRAEKKEKAEGIYKPTEEGWMDAPFTKMGELAGGSLPYMAAPLAVGAGALLLPEAVAAAPILGGLTTLGTALGVGGAGLTSAAQLTGSNLSSQVETGKKLGETDLTAAALASIPQAALDMVSMKMMPGVRNLIFKGTGAKLSEKAAQDVAKQNMKQVAADYLKATGKTMSAEGLTEAGQQVFERMQAGLDITDAEARKEYFDNFVGGAVLGGMLAPMGHMTERSQLKSQQAKTAREAEQKSITATQEAAQKALEEKQADPAYLTTMMAKQDEYSTKFKELSDAAKAGAKNDPLAQSKRDQAKAELGDLLKSEEYQAHKDEFSTVKPQVDALRIKQAQAAEKTEADAQAQADADLQDPVKQDALYTLQGQLMGEKSNAALQAQQHARAGRSDQAVAAQKKVQELDAQLAQLKPLLGKRSAGSAPALQENQIQEQLLRLAGGTNAKGKEIQGAYTQALMSGKHDDANAMLQQINSLHKQLAEIERVRSASEARMGTLADEEDTTNEPGQGIYHAPLPGINTNAMLRGVFGKQKDMIPGVPQGTGEKTRVGKPAAETKPGTTEYQQESMFSDMEPGGNAGAPLENLRTQIDQLKNRPNMPAATLAQLAQYQRVLENPAFENTGNTAAQNALADISENINRIAYQGAGQGAERNASVGELRSKIADVNKRLETIAGSIEQAKADVRNKLRSEDDTRTDIEVQYDRSTELRDLLRTQKELGAERQRLLNAQTVNLTPYERQQKQFVALGAAEPTEATPEQVQRTQKGDKRGYEAGTVNVEPQIQQDIEFQLEPGEDGEMVTVARQGAERAAAPVTSLDRGLARVTRTGERVMGVERANAPSIAAEVEAQLSEKDTQTVDMWDDVFGPASPASRAVNEAEEALQTTQQAVAATEKKLKEAQNLLLFHQQQLQKVIAADPEAQKRMFFEGEELLVRNKAAKAQAAVTTAEQVREDAWKAAEAQVRETQAAVAAAKNAAQKAQASAEAALTEFGVEWNRAQKSGWLTPELLQFVQGRDIKEALATAQKELADIANETKSQAVVDAEAAVQPQPRSVMRGIVDTLRNLGSTKSSVYGDVLAVQRAHVEAMPAIRRNAGPRVAEIVDTIFKLRIADLIIGKAQVLAEARATKEENLERANKRLADKVVDAKAVIEARGETLSQNNVKVEIARAEAEFVEQQLAAIRTAINRYVTPEDEITQFIEEVDRLRKDVQVKQKALAAAVTAPKTSDVEKARRDVIDTERQLQFAQTKLQELTAGSTKEVKESREKVNAAKKTVAQTEERLKNLQDSQNTRITEARTNLQRAKDTQQMLFENEQALRDGRPMPLQVAIDAQNAALRAAHDAMETALADSAMIPTIELEDVSGDLQTVERHVADLQRVETALVKLLQKHVSDFVQAQEDVETLLDTSVLLESNEFDPERENAQRIVNKAGVIAQLRELRAEEARTLSQRDSALQKIERLQNTNEKIISEKVQSDAHLARLEQQRSRLLAQHEEATKLFADRLLRLRDKMAALQPELDTAPDPKLQDWGRTQIETLRGLRDRLQEQITHINSRIKMTQRGREAAMKQQYALGRDRILSLEALGMGRHPSTIEAKRADLTDRLVASIKHQRAEERRADTKVESAYRRMKATRARLFGVPLHERGAQRRAAADARKAWREAALYRANLQDDLIKLERMQLSLGQALAALPPVPVAKTTPAALTQYTNEKADLERAERLHQNAKDAYERIRNNPKSKPNQIAAAEKDVLDTRMRLVEADKRKPGYVNTEGARVQVGESAPTVTSEPTTEGRWSGMMTALEDGSVRGPQVEEETPELQALRERVGKVTNWKTLAKELGSLRSAFEGAVESFLHGTAGKTMTRGNATQMRRDTVLSRAIVAAQHTNKKRDESLDLYDKMSVLEDRIDQLRGGRGLSLARLTETQPTAGRRGTAMTTDIHAGDWRVGDETRSKANATGSKKRVEERKVVTTPTAQQVVTAANKDVAKGSILRRQMQQAKIERVLAEERAKQSAAKSTYDIVMETPNISEEAKARVTQALKTADARVDLANKALIAEMKSKPLTAAEGGESRASAEAASQFRSDRETTEVDDDVVAAVQDGRTLDVLKLLAARGSTADVRARAAKLLPLLMRTKIKVDSNVMLNGKPVAGLFNPGTNTVTMHPGGINEEDLLHELTHAATDRSLLLPDSDLTADQIAAKRDLERLRTSIVSSPLFADEDIGDTREFAAEIFSNKSLRDKLDSVGKPRTLWQRVKDIISRLLGWEVPSGPSGKSADALVERLLQPSRALSTPDAAVTTLPAAASNWRGQKTDTTSAVGKLADMITAKPTSPMARFGSNAGLSIEMWGADMRAPLIKALSAAGEKALNQATYYVRKADALMNHVYASLSDGPLQLVKTSKGNFEVKAGNGPSMHVLLDAVKGIRGVSEQDKLNKLQAYIAAQRADRVGWDKLDFANVAELKKQAAAMRTELAADPAQQAALENARKVYNNINKGMVEFLAASGYISKAKAKELMQSGDYVPFYRVRSNGIAELVMGETAVIHVGDLRNNAFLAPLVGDNQKLLPLNEAIIRNTMLLTDMAMKNLATKDVAYALQNVGIGHGRNGRNSMPIHSGQAPAGADIIKFRQEPEVADPSDTGERWLRVDTKGSAVEHIPSEMLVRSLEGSFSTLPALLKAGAWFGDVLRSGVTRNPMYIVRQLVRDPLAATFTGGLEAGPVTAVFKSLSNYASQMTGRSAEGDVLVSKGLLHSGIFTGDVDDIKKMMLQLSKGDQNAWQKTMAWWDKAAMNADAATRIQMYKDARAKGMDEMEAELAAMEMMNFNKRGLSPSVQYAARLIPFLNAQIQGLNVLYKAATGQMPLNERLEIREKFYRRALTMTAFTVMYAMAMEDDETYKNARPRDKYNNWILPNPFGGESFRVPAPFEVGVLFKVLPEAIVDIMRDKFGTEEFKAVRSAFIQQIPGATSYGLPQIIKPLIEVVANHDFLTGREIESPTDKQKIVEERFSSGTSEMSKGMSKTLNAVGIPLSPKDLDKLISGYLGSLPVMVARLTNSLFAEQDAATRPEERASDSPVYGALFQREFGGGAVDAAYAHAKALEQAKKTYDSMVSDGRYEDAQAYQQKFLDKLLASKDANRFSAQMATLQKLDKQLRNTIKDPTVLRERLDALDRQRQNLSAQFLSLVGAA